MMRRLGVSALVVVLAVGAAACSSDDDSADDSATGSVTPTSSVAAASGACKPETVANGADGATVAAVVERVATANDLTTVLYRVMRGGEVVASGARGDNYAGSPADASLHFRVGNVAFGYMGTLLLRFVEEGKATLDDPISTWVPDSGLPGADEVTLRMLVQNTSGYADYVRTDAFVDKFLADPFAAWTPQELIDIGMATPPSYPPGTAWSYAHTNYVILGEALEKIGGHDLGALLTDHIFRPLGLADTAPALTPDVPAPVLRSYSTERRVFEETTNWNPSWQTAPGSVVTSTICDMATSATRIMSGALLDQASSREAFTAPAATLQPPPASCTACIEFPAGTWYGLGVITSNGWVFQGPSFAGTSGIAAYLPADDLTVALLAVAGKQTTAGASVASTIWTELATELTPDHIPTPPG